MILQKTGERCDLVVNPYETETKTMGVSCSLLCEALILRQIVSLHKHNCCDLLRRDIQNNKQTILHVRRGNHRANMILKAGYVLVKAFFLINSQCIMADIILKKSSDVSFSHIFLFFIILLYSSTTSVQ